VELFTLRSSDAAVTKGAEVAFAGEGDVTRGSSIDSSIFFSCSRSKTWVDFCGVCVAVEAAGVDRAKAASRLFPLLAEFSSGAS